MESFIEGKNLFTGGLLLMFSANAPGFEIQLLQNFILFLLKTKVLWLKRDWLTFPHLYARDESWNSKK